jgi:hypothetical protein
MRFSMDSRRSSLVTRGEPPLPALPALAAPSGGVTDGGPGTGALGPLVVSPAPTGWTGLDEGTAEAAGAAAGCAPDATGCGDRGARARAGAGAGTGTAAEDVAEAEAEDAGEEEDAGAGGATGAAVGATAGDVCVWADCIKAGGTVVEAVEDDPAPT